MTVLHLSAAGVPTGWSVTALYAASYGVALASTIAWRDKTGTPQAVIEINDGSVGRSELFWPAVYDSKQYPDREVILQAPPVYGLSQDDQDLVSGRMRDLLKEIGFLIPREDWERRYPASLLVERRFSEWHAACRAAGDGPLPWEPRWAMFMDPPDGWKPEFTLTPDGLGVEPTDEGCQDTTSGYRWGDEDAARAAMRFMNSGWTFEEALVLARPEPIDYRTPTLIADERDDAPTLSRFGR